MVVAACSSYSQCGKPHGWVLLSICGWVLPSMYGELGDCSLSDLPLTLQDLHCSPVHPRPFPTLFDPGTDAHWHRWMRWCESRRSIEKQNRHGRFPSDLARQFQAVVMEAIIFFRGWYTWKIHRTKKVDMDLWMGWLYSLSTKHWDFHGVSWDVKLQILDEFLIEMNFICILMGSTGIENQPAQGYN